MKKRGKIKASRIFLILFILLSLTHATMHFLIYGVGIETIDDNLISGLAISQTEALDQIKQNYNGLSNTSRYIITIEWLLILVILVVILVKGKIDLTKDTSKAKKIKKGTIKKKPKPSTDLDTLYDLLKDKKSIRVSTISKLFGITEKTATNWCKILESGNLAELRYPMVGSPKLVIIKNVEKEENE